MRLYTYAASALILSGILSRAADFTLPLKDVPSSGSFVTLRALDAEWATPAQLACVLAWKMPPGFESGWYRLQFDGLEYPVPATKSANMGELYLVDVLPGSANAHGKQHSFTYVMPGEPRREPEGFPGDYPRRDRLARRQSEQLLYLQAGDLLQVELRYPKTLFGNASLVAVPEGSQILAATTAKEPFHCFTDKLPPAFDLHLKNEGTVPTGGTLRITTGDAISGKETERAAEWRLDAAGQQDMHLEFPRRNGVFYTKLDLLDGQGNLLTRLWRYYSYSTFIDAKSLPLEWPWGFHIGLSAPLPPPCGFKWIRLFQPGWYEMEPKEGKIDWGPLDYQINRCREGGYAVLYVGVDCAKWARPNSPDIPRAFAEYGPTKPGALEEFIKRLWERYAPGGKLDTLRAIEIFNEPNCKLSFATNYAEYVKQGKIIYDTTKKYAPDATVVGICLSGGIHRPFVHGVLTAGIAKYMDIASLHLYEIGSPLGKGATMASKIAMFKDELQRAGAGNMPIWNTESGANLNVRNEGVALTQEKLNAIYRSNPNFDPKCPWVVDGGWIASGEELTTAWMIRASIQQLALGVKKNFYFLWASSGFGWVTGSKPGDNPMPRLKIPAQAALSVLWRDYGGRTAEVLNIDSPNPEMMVLSYRFSGPKGTMTAVFTHPKGADRSTGDEVAAKATGDDVVPQGDARWVRLHPFVRSEEPPSVLASIPVVSGRDVVLQDWLGRERTPLSVKDGQVAVPATEIPVYILEDGVFPEEAGEKKDADTTKAPPA